MPIVQTKAFWRIAASSKDIPAAIDEVTTEVNEFIAVLPNMGDVLDIRHQVHSIDPQRLLYSAVVIFVKA